MADPENKGRAEGNGAGISGQKPTPRDCSPVNGIDPNTGKPCQLYVRAATVKKTAPVAVAKKAAPAAVAKKAAPAALSLPSSQGCIRPVRSAGGGRSIRSRLIHRPQIPASPSRSPAAEPDTGGNGRTAADPIGRTTPDALILSGSFCSSLSSSRSKSRGRSESKNKHKI